MSTAPQSRDPSTKTSTFPYVDLVKALLYRYPILQYLIFFVEKQPLYPVRAAVLEFQANNVTQVDFYGKDGLEKLRLYLKSATQNTSQPKHRLYLLEDLDPSHIELLGGHLNIDGTVFASQIRDAHYSGKPWNGHAPKLPAFQNPHQSFTLRYYEAKYFDDPSMPEFSSSVQTLANVPRAISFGKADRTTATADGEREGHVGHIRRNTSFWSSKESDGGWNGIMLLDPPTGNQVVFCHHNQNSQDTVEHVKSYPYQRGYRDFSPWPSMSSLPLSETQLRGPKRISLLDDICYYWQHISTPSQISSAMKDPFQSSQFQLHIIGSIWVNTLEHTQARLSDLETMLWVIERMISPNLSDEKKDQYMRDFTRALNEANTLRRRLGWYVGEMRGNLDALGIVPPSSATIDGEGKDHARNFVAIYERLITYQSWAEKLLGVITANVNLMETEKSIADSKSLSRLTILGFFFVPVSFVASFFSMGGEFAVGQGKFWVYFAVTIPLCIAIVAAAFGRWRFWWRTIAVRRLHHLWQ